METFMAEIGEYAAKKAYSIGPGLRFDCIADAPEIYWAAASDAVRRAKQSLPKDEESAWKELERLTKLEDYVRRCQELAAAGQFRPSGDVDLAL
jgi:hypothetical protein